MDLDKTAAVLLSLAKEQEGIGDHAQASNFYRLSLHCKSQADTYAKLALSYFKQGLHNESLCALRCVPFLKRDERIWEIEAQASHALGLTHLALESHALCGLTGCRHGRR